MEIAIAPRSKLPTAIPLVIVVVALGFALAAVFVNPALWYAAAGWGGLLLLGFCWCPCGYELDTETREFTVVFPLCRKRLGTVTSCEAELDKFFGCGIRLWANGGLFGFSGWFWSRAAGAFRVYATTACRERMVALTIGGKKVIISPADAVAFAQTCAVMLESGKAK